MYVNVNVNTSVHIYIYVYISERRSVHVCVYINIHCENTCICIQTQSSRSIQDVSKLAGTLTPPHPNPEVHEAYMTWASWQAR